MVPLSNDLSREELVISPSIIVGVYSAKNGMGICSHSFYFILLKGEKKSKHRENLGAILQISILHTPFYRWPRRSINIKHHDTYFRLSQAGAPRLQFPEFHLI